LNGSRGTCSASRGADVGGDYQKRSERPGEQQQAGRVHRIQVGPEHLAGSEAGYVFDEVGDHLLLAQFNERQAAVTPDAEQAAAILKAAHDQRQSLASQAQAQIGDVAALTSFLLRQGERSDAGVWLDRLENGVKAHANNDPRAIALLIELRTTHGTLKQCEPWIGRLEAIDRDPIRPLIARVRYLAALGQTNARESPAPSATSIWRSISCKEPSGGTASRSAKTNSSFRFWPTR